MDLKTALTYAQKKFRDKSIPSAQLDAEVLLLDSIDKTHRSERDKSWMYLNLDKHILSPEEEKIFKAGVRRREKFEPIAYITGRKEFYGIDFFVNKDVLIPRAETEIIVDEVLSMIKNSKKNFTLIDIGTGSGCIPISILSCLDSVERKRIKKTFANDISTKALEVAKRNAEEKRLLSKITFLECDLEQALKKIHAREDVIITANLPYVTEEDYMNLKPNVLDFEPRLALTAPEKGLYHIRRLIETIAALSPNLASYRVLLEADPGQMRTMAGIAKKNMPGCKVDTIKDLRGKKRVMEIADR